MPHWLFVVQTEQRRSRLLSATMSSLRADNNDNGRCCRRLLRPNWRKKSSVQGKRRSANILHWRCSFTTAIVRDAARVVVWEAKDSLGNCLKGENNCYLHFLLFLLLGFVPFLVLVHISPFVQCSAPCPLQLLCYQSSVLHKSVCSLVDCPCPQELVFVLPAKLIMFFIIELMIRFLPARRI